MIVGFKDYFSEQAAAYATHRPHYPDALFDWLSQQCQQHTMAWDCATGNGQAAIALTPYFQQVAATDGSAAQIGQATRHPQVTYRVAIAENSGLASNNFDLVTVAQAVHWFNREAFYREVQRVLKPGGILAIWCYGRPVLPSNALDQLLENYYNQTLDNFWTPERRLVEEGYRSLPFPFQEIATPAYTMRISWQLSELIGYLYTWSATQRFIKTYQVNPLEALAADLAHYWPSAESLVVSWPIYVRAGHWISSSAEQSVKH